MNSGVSPVLGLEALFESVVVDEDRGAHEARFAQLDVRAAAPGQELRVALHVVYQPVHPPAE